MQSDILNVTKKIVVEQDKLISSFDKWVYQVKENDLAGAGETVQEANELRKNISILNKELDKLNKRSGIVLVKH